MDTILTIAAVIAVTLLAIRHHLRKSASPAKTGAPAAGSVCPRCGAATNSGMSYCERCGVPQQIFEIAGARTVTPEDGDAKKKDAGREHAMVRADVCVGCGTCVPACPISGAIRMEGKLAVVDPDLCGGHAACVDACPLGGIVMGTGEAVHHVEVPDVGPDFQSNVEGIWIVGELGGRGLIKNAINEGKIATESVARDLDREFGRARAGAVPTAEDLAATPFDVVIVGSGPAGLSAGLEAHRRGLRYLILEQGSLADSIRRYPRHKLLLAEPVTVPLFGDLWIADASKETLLEVWETIIEKTGLEVSTGRRVTNVIREASGLRIEGADFSVLGRRVILALGRRGTPRQLGVPGEETEKVCYDVVEMEEFRGRRVLIVGGGDSALESAVGMSNQPGTEVTLSYRKGTFDRAKDRNVGKLNEAERAGKLTVLRKSSVREIRPDEIVIDVDGDVRTLPNDDVVIRIGGEPPTAFLEKLGIRSVKREIPIAQAQEAVHA